jgi:hypothetical protein
MRLGLSNFPAVSGVRGDDFAAPFAGYFTPDSLGPPAANLRFAQFQSTCPCTATFERSINLFRLLFPRRPLILYYWISNTFCINPYLGSNYSLANLRWDPR